MSTSTEAKGMSKERLVVSAVVLLFTLLSVGLRLTAP